MAGTTDKVKGRAKVAVGAMTGDRELENEGRLDRLVGAAKDTLADVSRSIERRLGDAGRDSSATVAQTRRRIEGWLDDLRR